MFGSRQTSKSFPFESFYFPLFGNTTANKCRKSPKNSSHPAAIFSVFTEKMPDQQWPLLYYNVLKILVTPPAA